LVEERRDTLRRCGVERRLSSGGGFDTTLAKGVLVQNAKRK